MTVRLHLDKRGRVALGKFLPNFEVHTVKAHKEGNKIILEPMVEIPADELWLFQNAAALASVQRGLKQSAAGDVTSVDIDFSEFADEDV